MRWKWYLCDAVTGSEPSKIEAISALKDAARPFSKPGEFGKVECEDGKWIMFPRSKEEKEGLKAGRVDGAYVPCVIELELEDE